MSSDADVLPGRARDGSWICLIKAAGIQGYRFALDPVGFIRIQNGRGPADMGESRASSTVNTKSPREPQNTGL